MPPKHKRNQQTNKKIKTESTPQNLCIVCGVDIGDANPRQLCGKTYCMYKDDFTDLIKIDEPEEISGLAENATKNPAITTNAPEIKKPTLKIVKKNPDRIEFPESSDSEDDIKSVAPPKNIPQLRPRNYKGKPISVSTQRKIRFVNRGKDPSWADSETESSESISDESCEETAETTEDNSEYEESFDDEEDMTSKLIAAIKQFTENKEKAYMDMQYAPETHEITENSHISMLKHIRTINQNKVPSVKKILNSPCNVELKAKAIEYLIRVLNNTPELSEEWIKTRNKINRMITNPNNLTDDSYLEYMRIMRHKNIPTIPDVIAANMSIAKKIELIDLLELADREYTHPADAKKYIEKVRRDLYSLNQLGDDLRVLIESEESKLLDKTNLTAINDVFSVEKTIAAKYDTITASKILSEYINGMKSSTDEKYKTIQWAKYITSMPNDLKPFPVTAQSSVEEIRNFRDRIQEKFDSSIFGMQPVKSYLINYVMHVVSGAAKNHILALCGPPGIGKTTIANAVADCIGLPFVPISIGGQGDASELKGHSRTYVRAVPGKIVQGLAGLKYKNAVIFIDEVDKISGRHENELAGILTHLLDPSANHAFVDDYLGYPIDLSHVLFVLAFNDATKINHILRDRMEIMHLKGYSMREKVTMLQQYLLPREAKSIGFDVAGSENRPKPNAQKMRTLRLPQNSIEKLVTKSKVKEEGVRQLIRNLRTVLKKINTLVLVADDKFIKSSYDEKNDIICITAETMETLFEETDERLNKDEPPISMYN